MSFDSYGLKNMDLPNGEDVDSAETLTSTLKAVLKINGSSVDVSQPQDEEDGQSQPENAGEEEDKKESREIDGEQAAGPVFGATGGPQNIDLSHAADGECISIYGDEVTIITSPNSDTNCKSSGSDKVRIKPITKYEWDHKYYNGALVSVTSNYMAYAIKAKPSVAVRVISRKNTSDRLLLRGFTAPVCDVAFAHSTSAMIAAIDEDGNFLLWQLSLNGESTTAKKKLHVKSPLNDSTHHRLVWLTYMHCGIDGAVAEQLLNLQENVDDDDPAMHRRLLAVSHGKTVDVWDVNAAFEVAEDNEEDTEKDKLSATFMTVSHEDLVTDCVLSPEGSVIAVASNDGYVKFWQVSIEDVAEPTCLHRWQPHGDRPVSLVTFCDDRTQSQLVLYWRFMLTGCSHNSELKIWCTVSWSCLQTISFKPAPGSAEIAPSLKCVLHVAADYLVVADINRKVVYVMHCLADLDTGKASLSSISQYLLTTPMLSFAISDARKCKFKTLVAMDEENDDGLAPDGEDAQESDREGEDEGSDAAGEGNKRVNGVLIQLVSINTKSLESLDIRFVPNKPSAADESMISYSTYNTASDELNVVSMDESMSIVSPSRNKESDDAQQDEMAEETEEEDEEGTKNNTVLTGTETEQSTLVVVKDDDDDDEESDQKNGEAPVNLKEDSGTLPKDMLRTRVADLVDDFGTDEPPLAHSSPNIRRQFDDPEESSKRGQGEGEAAASPEDAEEVHPLLLTPDAFTASCRKPEDLLSADTTFTHVTPFSVDHPSLLASERDSSLQESTRMNPPILSPSSVSLPPGFPPISTAAAAIYKPEEDRQATPPLVTPASERSSQRSSQRSSLDATPAVSSYHSILTPTAANEPGPFGDISTYMTKGPDLISSASSIENSGPASVDLRAHLGAVGGSGDALFLVGHAKSDVDNESRASGTSMPATPPAQWPKAPDVTMSRPAGKKSTPSASREEVLGSSDGLQELQATSLRLDSASHANSVLQPVAVLDRNLGADLLAAIKRLQDQQEEMAKSIQKDISKKTNQISRNVEASLKKIDQQQSEKLDRALKSMADSQRKFQADSRTSSAYASEQMSGRIDRAIKQEMKGSVLPNLTKSLDPIKDQLLSTVSQKITATDSVLKDQIGKMARSKDTVEAIGNAAGRILQSQVHSTFRDTFMQILVPAMEKSCDNMFQQLAATFQRGTNDVVAKLEKQMQSRVKAELERISATEKQAREATTELKDAAAHLQNKILATIEQSVQKLVSTETKRIQDSMGLEMSKAFQHQHEVALKEQKTALTECIHVAMAEMLPRYPQGRSRLPGDKSPHAATSLTRSPGPIKPTFEQHQQVILNHLQQGNINAAFQRALTASDLALVMYVCEMVDPTAVFGSSPCALHQPIILSLIQQLSCDLGNKTVIKLKYLQEAVMSLDPSHQVTQEHMRSVLDGLVKSLDAHIAALNAQPKDSSNTPVIKEMRMLSMAAKSLCQQ